MERVEKGSYVLINGRNHRILDVDYLNRRFLCYWIAKPKDSKWMDWENNFEVIGWNPL